MKCRVGPEVEHRLVAHNCLRCETSVELSAGSILCSVVTVAKKSHAVPKLTVFAKTTGTIIAYLSFKYVGMLSSWKLTTNVAHGLILLLFLNKPGWPFLNFTRLSKCQLQECTPPLFSALLSSAVQVNYLHGTYSKPS